MKMFTFPQKYTPEMAISMYLSVDISCYRRTWFCAVQLNRRGTSSQLLKDVQAQVWSDEGSSSPTASRCVFIISISYQIAVTSIIQLWCEFTPQRGSTKGLCSPFVEPETQKSNRESWRTNAAHSSCKISSLLSASFVLCFQNIKYMYTAVVHFSFLLVLHLCASLWVFLMDDFHHTADKRPTLTHLENRAFYVASFRFCYH